jgi:hypothetical protein
MPLLARPQAPHLVDWPDTVSKASGRNLRVAGQARQPMQDSVDQLDQDVAASRPWMMLGVVVLIGAAAGR